jgi:hypothetical protein
MSHSLALGLFLHNDWWSMRRFYAALCRMHNCPHPHHRLSRRIVERARPVSIWEFGMEIERTDLTLAMSELRRVHSDLVLTLSCTRWRV